MTDLCGFGIPVGHGFSNLKVKNVLRMRNDVKVKFLTEGKFRLQVILPYRYFGYGEFIKKGELYNLTRGEAFIDNDSEVVENYQLTSIDDVKNFNLYY